MIKNYVIVAIRNMLKNKSYLAINTLGLSIALACCISAYILIAYNIEFDSYHKKETVKNIFKFHTFFHDKSGNSYQDIYSPIALGPQAASGVAGIESFTRYINQGGTAIYGENVFNENFTFVDSAFLDMFDLPLKYGDSRSLKDINTIFLTEEMAEKYFGDQNPIGQTLEIYLNSTEKLLFTVGGVFKHIPINNTFSFSFLLRIEHYLKDNQLTDETWNNWRNPTTFVKLTSPGLAESMTDMFKPFIERRNEVKLDEVVTSYQLIPFLNYQTGDEIHATFINMRIPLATILIFITMAGLILLIACFNLTNTSIALTAKRLKEIGIKKSIGAERRQIIFQFLFETILGALLSISGVFALASLNIVKRTKEIGIRKVLGATEGSIIGLLNKEFVWVLSAAVILGSTGGFFLTSMLLDQIYAYHITVGIPAVILCAVFIFGIGILTTSATIFKAAVSDPVETLRKE